MEQCLRGKKNQRTKRDFSGFTAIIMQSFAHKYRRSRIFHQITHQCKIVLTELGIIEKISKNQGLLKNIRVQNILIGIELNRQEEENY